MVIWPPLTPTFRFRGSTEMMISLALAGQGATLRVRLSRAATPGPSEGRAPQPRRVDGEAQTEADEPRVVVQAGPDGWYLHLRHGGEEPGQTGSDARGEGDEAGNVKAPAIPVGPARAVQARHVQVRVADEVVIGDEHAADAAQERRIRDQPLEDVHGRI